MVNELREGRFAITDIREADNMLEGHLQGPTGEDSVEWHAMVFLDHVGTLFFPVSDEGDGPLLLPSVEAIDEFARLLKALRALWFPEK